MRKFLTLLLVLCLAGTAVKCQQDQYFSEYYLGRQDELNHTFIKIEQKIQTLNNVTWRVNDTFSYIIGGIKPKFYYIDTKQRADIVGHDTVVIEGGRVQVTFDFQWARTGTGVGGNGTAVALSDVLAFDFTLEIKDGYMLEKLHDWDEVRFNENPIKITRINPPDIFSEDLKNLQKMMNNVPNITTVKHELEDDIEKFYQYFLNQSLYDDRRIIDSHYDYSWMGPKGKFTIEYEMVATGVDIQPTGITLLYLARIKNDPAWKCYEHAPSLPLNPRVYGGIQEFVTWDVYRNTLRYAIDNGYLDVDLDRQNWQSRFFQFYAGDLYEVIPKVTQRFLAYEPVTGSCRTSSRYLDLKKGGYDYINVSMLYNCQIGVNRDKVMQFQLNLTIAVQGIANQTHLNFHVLNQTNSITLVPYMDYTIANPTLAKHMISHSLNRLHGHQVFGSGWKLYERDYPHFIVEDNYTIVYDSTHVDPHNRTVETMQE